MKTKTITGGQHITLDLATEEVNIIPYPSGSLAIQLSSEDVADTVTLKYLLSKVDELAISNWPTATDSSGEDITMELTSDGVPTMLNLGNVTPGTIFALSFTETSGTVTIDVKSN